MPRYFDNAPFQTVAWKRFPNGEILQIPLALAVSDEENDLVVYRFDEKILRENRNIPKIKPLKLAAKLPAIGEEALSIGYYGEYEFPFNSLGNIAMIDKNDDIFSDLTLMPGNSGAPVLNLETGEVLGVTTSVLDLGNETVRYGIAKKSAKLAELMKKL